MEPPATELSSQSEDLGGRGARGASGQGGGHGRRPHSAGTDLGFEQNGQISGVGSHPETWKLCVSKASVFLIERFTLSFGWQMQTKRNAHLCVCVCVCVRVCVFFCFCVCVCVCVCSSLCVCVVCLFVRVFLFACFLACLLACLFVCLFGCVCVCVVFVFVSMVVCGFRLGGVRFAIGLWGLPAT